MVRQGLAGLAFIIGLGGFAAASAPVESSLRPVMRPGSGAGGEVISVMRVSAVTPTLRPRVRPGDLTAQVPVTEVRSYPRNAAFERWVEGFKPRARRAGISRGVID